MPWTMMSLMPTISKPKQNMPNKQINSSWSNHQKNVAIDIKSIQKNIRIHTNLNQISLCESEQIAHNKAT